MAGLKIGILTFHRCINYGSFWQALCLVEGLKSMGHTVSIIDHQSKRVNLAEWRCAFQPVLPTVVPKADRPLYQEKIQCFFQAFGALPLSAPVSFESPWQMEEQDVVVVGSDEVWNLCHPWYGRIPIFYGDGLNARQVISYAASFGSYHSSLGLEYEWAERLKNFSSISVRDGNSAEIIRNAIGVEAKEVIDPCLQFPVSHKKPINEFPENRYIAVYGHNFSENFIWQIRQVAAKRKLQIISIGYRNDWADKQWITAGPFEFTHFIENSEAVATNFFHGCIFALRFLKPFVCESSPYRSNKLENLMARIGGTKHLANEYTTGDAFVSALSDPLDESVLIRIDQLRQISRAYLENALPVRKTTTA